MKNERLIELESMEASESNLKTVQKEIRKEEKNYESTEERIRKLEKQASKSKGRVRFRILKDKVEQNESLLGWNAVVIERLSIVELDMMEALGSEPKEEEEEEEE